MLREILSFFFFPSRVKFDKKCKFNSNNNYQELPAPKLRTILPHEGEQKAWYGLSEVSNFKLENKNDNK